MTAALMQKLLPAAKDPVSAALGSESGNSQSGVRGCVAREAFVRTMEDVIQTGRLMATNAFNDLGLPPDQVNWFDASLRGARDQARVAMGLLARGLMMVEHL